MSNFRKIVSGFASYFVTVGLLAIASGAAAAKGDLYAYAIDGNADFGIVDLNTGSFNACGNSGSPLAGIGVGPGGTIYSASWEGSEIWKVNPSDGSLTLVGYSGLRIALFGSTTLGQLYALDLDGNLYGIDPATGASTMIGVTGVPVGYSVASASIGSGRIYASVGSALYSINALTAKAKLIGTGTAVFGAMLKDKGTYYGGTDDGNDASLYTINTATGADSFVANVPGVVGGFWGLAPAPQAATGACPAR